MTSDLREAFDYASGLMACHPRDWSQDRRDAWLYGIVVGWDCEKDHEHDGACANREAIRELAERFGWSEADVATLRRHRAAVLQAQEEASRDR